MGMVYNMNAVLTWFAHLGLNCMWIGMNSNHWTSDLAFFCVFDLAC
jgi:hypothetical protein